MQAREKALANKRLVRKGGDLLADKRKPQVSTFAESAQKLRDFIGTHAIVAYNAAFNLKTFWNFVMVRSILGGT